MIDLRKVLRAHLIGDSNVTDDLAEYTFSTGQAAGPAIFTTRKLPDDASYPCIFINPTLGGSRFGCRDQRGGDPAIDVQVFDNRLDSDVRLEAIANAVWKRLDRGGTTAAARAELTALIVAEGCQNWGVRADLPRATGGGATWPSRTITVRSRLLLEE